MEEQKLVKIFLWKVLKKSRHETNSFERQMLNLPKDVEESLRGYKHLQGFSGVPEMDPLTLFENFIKEILINYKMTL